MSRAGLFTPAGRIWPLGRSLEASDIEDSTVWLQIAKKKCYIIFAQIEKNCCEFFIWINLWILFQILSRIFSISYKTWMTKISILINLILENKKKTYHAINTSSSAGDKLTSFLLFRFFFLYFSPSESSLSFSELEAESPEESSFLLCFFFFFLSFDLPLLKKYWIY